MDKRSFQFLLKIQMTLCKYVKYPASRSVLNLSQVVRFQEDDDTYYSLSLFFPGEFCFAWSFSLYWDIFERIFSHSFYRIWIDLLSEPCVRLWLVFPHHFFEITSKLLIHAGSLLLVPLYLKIGRRPVMLLSLVCVGMTIRAYDYC